jgi:hypothetical protein
MLRHISIALFVITASSGLTACGEVADDTAEDHSEVGLSEQELSVASRTLWPPTGSTVKTQISVCFENGSATQRNFVRTHAESSWEAIGNGTSYGVDFIGWGTCTDFWLPTPGYIWIVFDPNASAHSTLLLGREIQYMTFIPTADPNDPAAIRGTPDTVKHEFGHALGFTHEFRRPDFPTSPPCTETNGSTPDVGVFAAERASIMSYPSCGRAGGLTLQDKASFAALYGPSSLLYGTTAAIRHDPSWNFVRGDATPSAEGSDISADAFLSFVKVSGSSTGNNINLGDSVRIRTSNGQFLRANGFASSYLVDRTSTISSATTWQVIGASTAVARVNDRVRFKSNDGRFLALNGAQRLVTTTSGASWRVVLLPNSVHF